MTRSATTSVEQAEAGESALAPLRRDGFRGVWSGRRDRYSELRASMRDSAELHKVEMNYIGG